MPGATTAAAHPAARPVARALAVALAVALAGCASPPEPTEPTASPPPTPSRPPATAATTLPDFGHVWVLVLENTSYEQVVGSSDAPYINELVARYGLAERYSAVARPSQPNYLALFSGSTHGVTDNDNHDIDGPTIVDGIERSGRTWGAFAENYPRGCFSGATADGGRDGGGQYARKHMPALSFTSITSRADRCARVQDFAAFVPGQEDFAFLAPNLCHDMHDCSIADGDAWLRSFVPRILESDAFADDGVLFITFDEGETDAPGPSHVATIVASPRTPAGFRSTEPHDHFGLLRTIEDAWHLPCLADACTSGAMAEFFPPD